MDGIQDQKLKIIANLQQSKDVEEIIQKITPIIECIKKKSDDMISDVKDLRIEVNDIISDLKNDISYLEKKVDSLNDEIDECWIYLGGIFRVMENFVPNTSK